MVKLSELAAVKQLNERILTNPPVEDTNIAIGTTFIKEVDSLASTLNADQKYVFDTIIQWIPMVSDVKYLIKGYAGTGKSYLMGAIAAKILADNPKLSIAIIAPVGKAVKNIKEKVEDFVVSEKLTFATCHSILRFKKVTNDQGETTFITDTGYTSKKTLAAYDVVIVDEVSMMDWKIYQSLMAVVLSNRIKLIMVGDPAQLPPVTRDEQLPDMSIARPFMPTIQIKDSIVELTLNTIVRQEATNPIIGLSLDIREQNVNQMNIKFVVTSKKMWNDTTFEGAVVITRQVIEQHLMESLFGKAYDTNIKLTKLLCATNAKADSYNKLIRQFKFGDKANDSRFLVGDKIFANDSIAHTHKDTGLGVEGIKYSNNTEFVVIEVSKDIFTFQELELPVYKLKVKMETTKDYQDEDTDEEEEHKSGQKAILGAKDILTVLTDEAMPLYSSIKTYLTEEARAASDEGDKERRKKFYALRSQLEDAFANVKHSYAITIHKSQGSTFENVILDLGSLDAFKQDSLRRSLLYVAVTRTSKRLFIID